MHQNEYLWSKVLTLSFNFLSMSFKSICTPQIKQTTNFRLSKLKEFADDNFKFDENGRKLSKRLENTVGKGEITRY